MKVGAAAGVGLDTELELLPPPHPEIPQLKIPMPARMDTATTRAVKERDSAGPKFKVASNLATVLEKKEEAVARGLSLVEEASTSW